jgi:hypothetical protein
MTKFVRVSVSLFIASFAGACASTNVVNTAQVYDPVDSIQQYTQRADTVTLSAGNAQEVNSRIHTIDPWPRNVGNTRITGNGQRMADAVYRYRCGKPAPPALETESVTKLTPQTGGLAVAAGTGRPGSDCAETTVQGAVK